MARPGGKRQRQKFRTGYVPNRGHCPVDGKRIYLRHEAKRIARNLARNTSEKLVDYRCPDGHGWHVGHDFL